MKETGHQNCSIINRNTIFALISEPIWLCRFWTSFCTSPSLQVMNIVPYNFVIPALEPPCHLNMFAPRKHFNTPKGSTKTCIIWVSQVGLTVSRNVHGTYTTRLLHDTITLRSCHLARAVKWVCFVSWKTRDMQIDPSLVPFSVFFQWYYVIDRQGQFKCTIMWPNYSYKLSE